MQTEDRGLWIVFAACVLVAVLTLIGTQLFEPTRPAPESGPVFPRARMPRTETVGDLLRSLGIGSLTWYTCVLSAPFFVWLSRRLSFTRGRWLSSLAVYSAAITTLVVLTALLQHRLAYTGASLAPDLGAYLRAALLTGTLPFITVAAAAQAFEARRRAHGRELEAAQMRSQLAEARLEALSARLQPHFLFNTLQAISTLIRHDPEAADRVLAHLSDLLRELLRGGQREVSLADELRALDPYLEIARTRFGARLCITVTADEDAQRALVPFFVLQPLVENALQHGVSRRAGPASVRIMAARTGGQLVLTVLDDGTSAAASEPGAGLGLASTRARLLELYGPAASVDHGPRNGGGFQVRISFPYRDSA